MAEALLKVDDLCVQYRGEPPVQAVDGVTFTLEPGMNLGLVGESGCGKTTTARALIRLLPKSGSITGGQVFWQGKEITRISQPEMNLIRWKEIAFVPQSAMNSLDPVYRLRDQIIEAILTHEPIPKKEAAQRAEKLCTLVGIDPARLNDYPHQLSGGMKQRLVIAMALSLNPRLVIADEPTTALDVIVQDRILQQIIELQAQFGFAMIYISHDIGVISETCQYVAVMYAGKIVEYGPVIEVFKRPSHPYTMGLKNAFPDLRQPKQLVSLPGHPPRLNPPPSGCRFAPRCPFATDLCLEQDPLLHNVDDRHASACHYVDRASIFRIDAQSHETWRRPIEDENQD